MTSAAESTGSIELLRQLPYELRAGTASLMSAPLSYWAAFYPDLAIRSVVRNRVLKLVADDPTMLLVLIRAGDRRIQYSSKIAHREERVGKWKVVLTCDQQVLPSTRIGSGQITITK
jgi:hypothetical protein